MIFEKMKVDDCVFEAYMYGYLVKYEIETSWQQAYSLLHRILAETRRKCPKSAPYLRLKTIQGATIGNNWKKIYFLKRFLEKKFQKKNVFFKKSHLPKNTKRSHSGSLNVFTIRKLQNNARGFLLIEFENFRTKVA